MLRAFRYLDLSTWTIRSAAHLSGKSTVAQTAGVFSVATEVSANKNRNPRSEQEQKRRIDYFFMKGCLLFIQTV